MCVILIKLYLLLILPCYLQLKSIGSSVTERMCCDSSGVDGWTGVEDRDHLSQE